MRNEEIVMEHNVDYSDKFIQYLESDESILWTGKKEKKISPMQCFMGLIVTAFSVLWMYIVYTSGKGLLALIPLPLVFLGIMLMLGIGCDSYYAITEKRIISFMLKKPVSVYYNDIFNVTKKKSFGGTTTIIIKSSNKMMGAFGKCYLDNEACAKETILDNVYNGKEAYDLIKERALIDHNNPDDQL